MQVMTSPGVNYPGAFPGMHVINSSQRCLFLHMTLDLFETCLSFLDLRSITRLCMTSRLDQAHRDAVVRRWRRSCMERWASYRVRDWGTGPGIEFTVNRQDWVLASMAREWTETQFTPGMSPASRIEAVTEAIGRRLDMPNVLEEGLRWIVQLFDEHGEAEVCHARPNEITLRKLVFLMSRRMMDRDVQHLGLKVVGILSLNEQSRKVLPGMGVVDLLINALNIHDSSQHLIENALWYAWRDQIRARPDCSMLFLQGVGYPRSPARKFRRDAVCNAPGYLLPTLTCCPGIPISIRQRLRTCQTSSAIRAWAS